MIVDPQDKKFFAMRPLNLTHLATFSQVIAHGSFSAAADDLGLTQPAVSQHIRQLEERLKLRLIERVGKRLKPTSAGLTLLEHISRLDAVVEDALLALSSHAQGVVGQVAIGTGATACIHLLPPMLQALRRTFPALEVRVTTGNTESILKGVEENRLDLGLVTLPAAGRSLAITPLLQEDLVAIFCAHEQQVPNVIEPKTLMNFPFVAFDAASSSHLLHNEWFSQAGLRVKPIMELGSIEAIKEMVAAGLGYGIVPRMAVSGAHHGHGLQIRTLTPPLRRTLSVALRQDKPLSRALRQVVEALHALAQEKTAAEE